jgi:hypothetical protein
MRFLPWLLCLWLAACANVVTNAGGGDPDADQESDGTPIRPIDAGSRPLPDVTGGEDTGTDVPDEDGAMGPPDADAAGDDETGRSDAGRPDGGVDPTDPDASARPCTTSAECGEGEACVSGSCRTVECEPASSTCLDRQNRQDCSQEGSLEPPVNCTTLPGCNAGACSCREDECSRVPPNGCTPDARQCFSSLVWTCDAEGRRFTLTEACPTGAQCRDGQCLCPEGTLLCNGRCIDASADDLNCGACGNACPSGFGCEAGVCGCAGGGSLCDGVCIDTRSDLLHCGACGNRCPTGQVCNDGSCGCDGGLGLCNGFCIDLTGNSSNCGACGNVCGPGQSCKSATCECDNINQSLCSGECVDTRRDNRHCGACGNACPPGVLCDGGVCICPAGQTLCGGACTNTANDPNNCGACRNVCPSGACASGTCQTGGAACRCQAPIPSFYSICDASICPGRTPCCAPVFPGCIALVLGDEELAVPCR